MIDIKIEIINQLKDNYSYLLHHDNSLAIVIDPADDGKIINVLESKKLKLECIFITHHHSCLLYTSPSPRDPKTSRMPSSA